MKDIYINKTDNDWLTLVHYGAKTYDKTKVRPIKNCMNKPYGGLWTSPTWSTHSWKDWCECNDFRSYDSDISFKLKFNNAKIMVINSMDDLNNLPIVNHEFDHIYTIYDYEKVSLEYDAIWLTHKGEIKTRYGDNFGIINTLYGWDCESVLIINKDCCYQY